MKNVSMRLRKRVRTALCVLLAAAMVTSCLCVNGLLITASGEPRIFDIGVNPESVTARLDENGVLTVSGSGEIRDFTPETAPFAEENVVALRLGADITAVGDYAFYNCGGLGGLLELPAKLVRIGSGAFSGDGADLAPKPDFVKNEFVQAKVTRRAAAQAAVQQEEPEETESAPVEEPAAEGAALTGEPQLGLLSMVEEQPASQPEEPPLEEEGGEEAEPAEEPDAEAANPEEAGETEEEAAGEADPEPSPAPAEEETPSPEESVPAESEEKQFIIETVTQQEMGEAVFYPRSDSPAYSCQAANASFQSAVEAAGYVRAESVISATFAPRADSSEDAVTREMAVVNGCIALPALLPGFAGDEPSQIFGGWTELHDGAGVVRDPGSAYPVEEGETPCFIANWLAGSSLAEAAATGGKRSARRAPAAGLSIPFAPVYEENGETVALTGSVDLPEGSDFALDSASLSGDFTLIRPTESNGVVSLNFTGEQTAADTYGLFVQSAGSAWKELENDAAVLEGYLVSGASSVEFSQADSPTAAEGDTPALHATLYYDAGASAFAGGTVTLTFSYQPPEDEDSQEPVERQSVTLQIAVAATETETGQTASVAAGRQFAESLGGSATVARQGAVSAAFTTVYTPQQTDAQEIFLCLCTEAGSIEPFPENTGIVLADMSAAPYRYYYHEISAADGGKVPLSQFGYPGPGSTQPLTEKLAFAVDFSKVSAENALSAENGGEYFLALTHNFEQHPKDLSDGAKARFTVVAPAAANLSLEKYDDNGLTWSLGLSVTAPGAADSRYSSGFFLRLSLSQNGQAVKLPDAGTVTVNSVEAARNKDGSASFSLPSGGSYEVVLDFTKAPETMLAAGSYTLTVQMAPKTGLQLGSDADLQITRELSFTLARASEPERAIQVTLGNGTTDRIVTLPESGKQIVFDLTYENLLGTDTVKTSLWKKTASGYTKMQDLSPREVSGSGSFQFGVTLNGQTESGTYRVLVSVENKTGDTVAEQPYNFIVEAEAAE